MRLPKGLTLECAPRFIVAGMTAPSAPARGLRVAQLASANGPLTATQVAAKVPEATRLLLDFA